MFPSQDCLVLKLVRAPARVLNKEATVEVGSSLVSLRVSFCVLISDVIDSSQNHLSLDLGHDEAAQIVVPPEYLIYL